MKQCFVKSITTFYFGFYFANLVIYDTTVVNDDKSSIDFTGVYYQSAHIPIFNGKFDYVLTIVAEAL